MRPIRTRSTAIRTRLTVALLAVTVASVGAGWLAMPAGASAATPGHVVIVIHQSRTFDSVFGRYPGVAGLPVLEGVSAMRPDEPLLADDAYAATTAFADGAMTGFDDAQFARGLSTEAPFRVARQDLVPALWELAGGGVIADHTFAELLGGGAVNRRALFGYPVSPPLPTVPEGPLPAINGGSVLDDLEAAGVSWGVFVQGYLPDDGVPEGPLGDRFRALVPPLADPAIVGDQARLDRIGSLDGFHLAVEAGDLPAVSYVIGATGAGAVGGADALSANVSNALARSSLWSSTLQLHIFDAWGGFADHLAPPVVGGRQLGFRVPFVLSGPLVQPGVVDSVVRSHASIPRYLRDLHGLPVTDGNELAVASLTDLVTGDGTRPPQMLRDDVVRFLPGVPQRLRVLVAYAGGIALAIGLIAAAVVVDRRRLFPAPGPVGGVPPASGAVPPDPDPWSTVDAPPAAADAPAVAPPAADVPGDPEVAV